MPIMLEPALPFHQPVEHGLAFVAERRVAQVMCKSNRLGQIFVQLQGAANVPRDGRNLHRMSQSRSQVIAGSIEEDLGLVFEPA